MTGKFVSFILDKISANHFFTLVPTNDVKSVNFLKSLTFVKGKKCLQNYFWMIIVFLFCFHNFVLIFFQLFIPFASMTFNLICFSLSHLRLSRKIFRIVHKWRHGIWNFLLWVLRLVCCRHKIFDHPLPPKPMASIMHDSFVNNKQFPLKFDFRTNVLTSLEDDLNSKVMSYLVQQIDGVRTASRVVPLRPSVLEPLHLLRLRLLLL